MGCSVTKDKKNKEKAQTQEQTVLHPNHHVDNQTPVLFNPYENPIVKRRAQQLRQSEDGKAGITLNQPK